MPVTLEAPTMELVQVLRAVGPLHLQFLHLTLLQVLVLPIWGLVLRQELEWEQELTWVPELRQMPGLQPVRPLDLRLRSYFRGGSKK